MSFVLGDSVFNGQVRYVQHLVLLLVFLALQLVRMVLRVLSRLLPQVAQSQSRSKWMRLHITACMGHVAWPEKRVLVEGKWLRDGKRSDNRLPESGQAATGCGAQKDANVESYESLHKMVQGFIKDIDEKQIPVDPAAAALSYVDLPTLRKEADNLMAKMLSILSEPLLPENL